MRRFWIAVFVGLEFWSAAAFAGEGRLRLKGFNPEQAAAVREAFGLAAKQARECQYLADTAPWLRERMIHSFENRLVQISFSNPQERLDDECAHSSPSWVISSTKMELRPIAFHPVCRSLPAILFHEMLHMNWTFVGEPGKFGWGKEETVYDLEINCFPASDFRRTTTEATHWCEDPESEVCR